MMPSTTIDAKSPVTEDEVKRKAKTMHEEGQFDDCDDDVSVDVGSGRNGNGKSSDSDARRPSDLSTPASSSPTSPPPAESREEKNETTGDPQQISASGITKLDVLSGRGGGTNNHEGNRYFRRLCDQRRHDYVMAKKMRKREIAMEIVAEVRADGGRFLKRDDKTGEWEDIGEQRAISKTSQALREGLAQKMRQALVTSGAAEQMRLEASAPPSNDAAWQTPAAPCHVSHPGAPYAAGAQMAAPYWGADPRYNPPSRHVSPENTRKMPFSDHSTFKRRRMGF